MSLAVSDVAVTAVVVSFNRKLLLQRCLKAVASQTRLATQVLVVDNASTDGTSHMLRHSGYIEPGKRDLLEMAENTGGAGGFAAGIARAVGTGAQWIWMMDDDAEPHATALEELMKVVDGAENVYGSLAVHGAQPAWTTTLLGITPSVARLAVDVPDQAEVESLPFLGFLVHRDMVSKIGLPDAGYFIAADDVEYCLRARAAGARILIAGRSHIEHPKGDSYEVRVPGKSIICLRLPPWKRYYDTRNRVLIGRKYYGFRMLTQTIPGISLRMMAALVNEPRKLQQLWAGFAGFIDGVFGRKGRRHGNWGISQ